MDERKAIIKLIDTLLNICHFAATNEWHSGYNTAVANIAAAIRGKYINSSGEQP